MTSERGIDVTDDTDDRRGEQEGDLRPEEAFVIALPVVRSGIHRDEESWEVC